MLCSGTKPRHKVEKRGTSTRAKADARAVGTEGAQTCSILQIAIWAEKLKTDENDLDCSCATNNPCKGVNKCVGMWVRLMRLSESSRPRALQIE